MPGARPEFRLYIVGGQVGSARAEPDLRQALDQALPGGYGLQVIDLRVRPDLAAADNVMIAPTVLRISPAPQLRAVGVLDDPRALARALGLPIAP